MSVNDETREHIGDHTVYKYVGTGYLLGVPARDLTLSDLVEVEEREGVTTEEIEASGLYLAAEQEEVAPFCGAELADGERCRRRVGEWGERCYQHGKLGVES